MICSPIALEQSDARLHSSVLELLATPNIEGGKLMVSPGIRIRPYCRACCCYSATSQQICQMLGCYFYLSFSFAFIVEPSDAFHLAPYRDDSNPAVEKAKDSS